MISKSLLLEAREERAGIQRGLLRAPFTLITLTLNVPGVVKTNETFRWVFDRAWDRVHKILIDKGTRCVHQSVRRRLSGDEGYLLIDAPAERVKAWMVGIEETDALGRLYDLDVSSQKMGTLHREDLGMDPRACLICGGNAATCRRSGCHDGAEVRTTIYRMIVSDIVGRQSVGL